MDETTSQIKAEDVESEETASATAATDGNEQEMNNQTLKVEHIESHFVKKEESQFNNDYLNKQFSCDICFKHYKTGQALRRHKKIHTSDKDCPDCGKTFYSKKVMNVHHRKVHLKEFTHNCTECEYKTDIRQVFEVHIRTHTGEKPHKCKHCEKSFNDPSTLIYHTKLAHTKQGVLYCTICGKGCLGQSQLDRHQISHARGPSDGPIEYSEEFKALAIQDANQLGILGAAKKHSVGPTALRRWVKGANTPEMREGTLFCETCGKEFSTKLQLDSHQITHAKEGLDRPRNYTNEFKLKALLEAQQIGVLETAKKLSISYGTLREWKRLAKNPKQDSRCCELCGKELSTKTDLKKHLLAHSKGKERPREYSDEFKKEVTDFVLQHGAAQTIEKYKISSSSIQKWIKIRNNPLPCDQCSEVFGYTHHLEQHRKSCHGEKILNFNQERFSDFVLLNNIGEKLQLVDQHLSNSSIQSYATSGLGDDSSNTDLSEKMEKEIESHFQYLYPIVKTEVTEEVSDHIQNRNKNEEKDEFQYQVGEDRTPKEKENSEA